MKSNALEELQARIQELEGELSTLKRKIENIYTPLIELTNESLFLVDREGTYLFVTENMAANFHTPLQEIIGKKYGDFHEPAVTRAFSERIAEVFASGSTVADEHRDRFGKKDISRTFHPIKTAQGEVITVAVVGYDITERKKMERALRESEERYRALVESAGEALFTVDRDCHYLFITNNLAARYHVSAPEVIGKKYHDFHNPEESRIVAERVAEVFAGGIAVHDEHFGRQDRYVLRDFYPIKTAQPDGEITAVGVLSQDITERKTMEAALRESEEKYRSIVENSREGIYQRSRDRFVTANQAFADILGYESPEELIGSIRNTSEQLFVHTEDRARLRNIFDEVGFAKDFEMEWYRKDGSRVWVSLSSHGTRDDSGQIRYYQGICTDITQRKQLDDELKKLLSLLRAALESTADGLLIVDREGRVTNCNKKFLNMWHIPDNLAGSPDDSALLNYVLGQLMEPRQFLEKVEQLYADPLAHSMDILEFKDGRTFERYSQPQLLGDEPVGRVWSFRDVTERKRAEEEKRSLAERLQRAEKMEVLGTLAGWVAHDLNNVLGVLSGYSELLMEQIPTGNPLRGYAENIVKSSERAAAIIQDLLTLTRRGVMVNAVIDFNCVISNLLATPEFEKLKAHHPQVTVETDLDKDLLNINGSPVHLEKTVFNLVSNAVEAVVDRGEVMIRTENRYLDKALRGYDRVEEGDYVVLTVSDTGGGITAADLDKIFEPFYTKKKMARSGTGLGLAIVWGTVKDHNGYLDVQSAEGKGTTFTLYFPVTREARGEEVQKTPIADYMGHGESVLVVDDVQEQRQVATMLLMRLGYQVHAVSSGEEAVEYLKHNTADILVLDMIMDPGIDGLETYRRVIAINPHQKAIIVSGFSETDRVRKAKELGVGAYVKKPYVMEKIGVAIRDELSRVRR